MIVLASRSIRFVHGPFPDELSALRNVLFFPPAFILQIGIYREITIVARLRYRTRLDRLENGAPVLARMSAARVAAVGKIRLEFTKNMRKIGKLVIVVARKIYHAEAGSIGNISVRADTRCCCLCAKQRIKRKKLRGSRCVLSARELFGQLSGL